MNLVRVQLLNDRANVPTKANINDAGFDLYSSIGFIWV